MNFMKGETYLLASQTHSMILETSGHCTASAGSAYIVIEAQPKHRMWKRMHRCKWSALEGFGSKLEAFRGPCIVVLP